MAKYISIPTTTAGIPNITFNTDIINTVTYTNPTQFAIQAHGKTYAFTTSAAGAAGALEAVNKAIISVSGPIVTQVVLPTGVTITNPPLVS